MDQNISTAIILVASFIVFFAYTSSAYVSVQALSDKRDRIAEISEQAERLADKEEIKRAEYEEYLQNKEDFENIIPSDRDDARTLMLINSMAEANNVNISNVRISDGPYMSRVVRRTPLMGVHRQIKTVNVQFDATYEDFTRFVTSLERSRRVFDVVYLEFPSSPGRVYSFDMAAHTYRIESNF